MKQDEIIRRLDEIEARLFQQYRALANFRRELTTEIDPHGRRTDLGLRDEDNTNG